MNSLPLRIAFLLSCWAVLPGMAAVNRPAAQFTVGMDVRVVSLRVGPKGSVLHTGQTGTPVDGLSVEIPAGALTNEITINLDYNTGTLSLPSGAGSASGVFLKFSAEGVKSFPQLVNLHIRFNPARHKSTVVVGYAIDAKGRLRVLNQGPQDVKAGTATFSTLVPLLFTWIYA